jgi:hypothetical protein
VVMKFVVRRLLLVLFLLNIQVLADPIPRPDQVFGFAPGEDYRLADYLQIREYYHRLAAASGRVRVMDFGFTAEGRPMMLAIITSEQNMARLEEFRLISEQLARARLTAEEAEELAVRGKAVIWIDGGLHSTEVAHAQHSPELAYRLVKEETPEIRAIRENTILLQVPVMNPDGLDMVVGWYKKNLGTRFETSPLPELYQKYVGHDNNRDWYMITQPETRSVSRLLYELWYPQIVLNHHQAPPFPARIFIPPFIEPTNPNIPPLVMRGIDLAGKAMSARFEAEGKPGVVSRIEFNTWWNGGMRTAPCFHNMIGLLTETALYHYASPKEYRREDIPARFKNGPRTLRPSADYPHPWKGGWWRLGDAVDYMLTASMAVLDVGSRYRDQWLLNIYRMGRNAIELGENEAPYAFLIPPGQHDPSAAIAMLNSLKLGGIEIHRASAAFEASGRSFPEGTYVIYAAQPFRPHLMDMMEPQQYPEDHAGNQAAAYDITGWTLPMQMGVTVVRADEPFRAAAEQPSSIELPEVRFSGAGELFLVDRRWNTSYALVNDLLQHGFEVKASAQGIQLGDARFPEGTFVVRNHDEPTLKELAGRYRIPLYPTGDHLGADMHALRPMRTGLYKSWVANIDEGWTRWVLEEYRFPYVTIRDEDLRMGGLQDRFDVIILPSQTDRLMVSGHRPGTMPHPYTGGMGSEGVQALEEFASSGGVIVSLGAASELPLKRFGLPASNVLAKLSAAEFQCQGALLRMQIDSSDPLGYGMGEEVAAFLLENQVFDVADDQPSSEKRVSANSGLGPRAHSVARFQDRDLLMSGWIRGEEHIRGRSAVLRVPFGRGEIIMFGLRPQFRGQPHGTFKLLFNAIYLQAVRQPARIEFISAG